MHSTEDPHTPHPIREPLTITNDAEHAAAMAEIDRLWDLVPDTEESVASPEGERLSALVDAVMAYERQRWPIDED
jgi:antitoxin component HigA of HigAB toxin-antitoxin module